ncbi:peptidoglycan endopeptidase [Tatumella sp. TA1]|nr:peptidoglycan endopeptidase [Tatumella sp. TA1]
MQKKVVALCLLLSLYAQGVNATAKSDTPSTKLQREHNRLRLWQQVPHRELPTKSTSLSLAATVKKHQRQASLALLNRGIIPGSHELSWALLSPDELVRETGSPQLLATLEKVIEILQAQIGLPYRWGGQTPNQGFDCSGLVWFAFRHYVNWPLPRTASTLFNDKRMSVVTAGRLRRGDLIFFTIHRQNTPDHVGVYLGNQQFIEAPRTGLAIRISQLDAPFWQQHFAGARRVLTETTLRD